jgi:hypothetical protein
LLILTAGVLASTPASAQTSVLAGVSGLVATSSDSSGLANGELDLSLRADLRRLANRVDVRIDYMDREGFVDLGLWLRDGTKGNGSMRLLRELSVKIRLSPKVRLSLGRVVTPGDFWLIADGAKLDVDYTPWLSQSIYGGLRAITSGFRETHLTNEPSVLGLAGTALELHTRIVDGQLLFTFAQDRLEFSNQLLNTQLVREWHIENNYFLQGNLVVHPTRYLRLMAGARLGTRFDMQWNANTPFGPTQIGAANLSAVNAWGLVEWEPERLKSRLRLQYQFNYQHINLYQSQLIGTPGAAPVSSVDGDFADNALRLIGMIRKSLRGEFGYRLRWRQNGDIEHHLLLAARETHLWRGLGLRGNLDFEIINPAHIFFAPTVNTYVRAIFGADLTWIDDRFDAAIGFHYIDPIGSTLLSYQYTPPASGELKTYLFPFTVGTDKIVTASLFYTGTLVFAGFDVEMSVVSLQVRAMAQVGVAVGP